MAIITNLEEIKNAIDIVQIISKHVNLKAQGSRYSGLCPFHSEKSPSFTVTPSNGFYKCFGCGESGDAIKFIQKVENKTFPEAVETAAMTTNIRVQYDTTNSMTPEQLSELDELKHINNKVAERYRLDLNKPSPGLDYAKSRMTDDSIIKWSVGYAPDEWQFLTTDLINRGKFVLAASLGLVKTKNDKNYDTYRNRLMFPIMDMAGQVVGFGGRDLSGEKNAAKYMNSSDSKLYSKSSVLYGLNIASKPIKTAKKAYLVEGYMDVIGMHESGAENTVGTCGTALTEGQCMLLKRHTNHVVIFRDGDKPGVKAALRDIDLLLKFNFKVEVITASDEKDPFDVARTMQDPEEFAKWLNKTAQDAVMYKAEHFFKEVGEDIDKKQDAVKEVAEMLQLISGEVKREEYIKKISKQYGVKPKSFEITIKKIDDSQKEKFQDLEPDEFALPAWIKDKEEFYKNGFVPRIDREYTGYYFGTATAKLTRMTNFVIKPLLHIYHRQDNKRMIEVTNGRSTKIIEMASKSLISVEQFEAALIDEGFFYTEGGFNKVALKKLFTAWGEDSFPMCYELKSLGWQPEGFWSYCNMAFDGELKKYDYLGTVSINDKRFLSMSVSSVQIDVRSEDDIYKNDRFLTYTEPSINFEQWCKLMEDVYEKHSWMGIAFVMVTIFRDIVIQSTKVPHLYAYGAVQAGKSEFGESISNLFFKQMPAFNLNQGTDFAFFSRMERFRNCPNTLNEFDENAVKDEWFRAIKGAYDNEGREKGIGGKQGKTRSMDISCSLVIMGQILSTKDDNSVLSRCIPLAFRENNNRTERMINKFRELKSLEAKGLSGILVELLNFRELVAKHYSTKFSEMQKRLSDEFTAEHKSIKSRILKNIAAPMAMVELLHDKLKLPFTKEQFYDYGKVMIEQVSNLITESNSLAEFWRTMEYLLDRNEISEGIDFKIEVEKSVWIHSKDKSMEHHFEEPTKILYIRLNTIHTLYADQFKRKYNKPAPNLDTIRLYLQDQAYHIGLSKGSRFRTIDGKSANTSSVMIDYDKLGANLERFSANEIERPEIEVTGRITKTANRIDELVTFSIMAYVTKNEATETVYYKIFYRGKEDVTVYSENVLVKIKGLLTEKPYTSKEGEKRISRQIDAKDIQVILQDENGTQKEISFTESTKDDLPF